ncbi:cysteine hydrolase family protein [Paenibacillus sp. 8b26]|uniref:cysteine hydrolase family protein n=1 Tax=Paenibacillus sp. 8b26 TaxID=3424133 RepID=UPI003D650BD5
MFKLGNQKSYWQVSETLVDLRRTQKYGKPVTLPAQPQEIIFDLEHTALIVIDMQNDFCTPGGWLDSIGADTSPLLSPVSRLNRLLPELRKEGVPVIWVNWGNREDRMNVPPSVLHVYNLDGRGNGIGDALPGNGSKVLEKGSWGAAIVDGLDAAPDDIYVDKYRMSGFWDTPLDSILRNLHIQTVLFAGVNLDQCVMHTLQDAACLGYDGILLEDCSATNSPAFCMEATLYNIKQCYGFVADSNWLVEELNGAAAHTEGNTPEELAPLEG